MFVASFAAAAKKKSLAFVPFLSIHYHTIRLSSYETDDVRLLDACCGSPRENSRFFFLLVACSSLLARLLGPFKQDVKLLAARFLLWRQPAASQS